MVMWLFLRYRSLDLHVQPDIYGTDRFAETTGWHHADIRLAVDILPSIRMLGDQFPVAALKVGRFDEDPLSWGETTLAK